MKQQVHGNVTGVRDTLIEALGQLYDYEVDEDTFLPRELMQVLARFTGVLNREIAVYITRDGEVVDVSIGTDRDVELRDYRLRRNTQRLSCVRCIHTHPNGDGRLSDVDLSALRSFRYDAMVAIGCLKGEPTFVQSAFLVEKQNLLMDEPVRWYKTPDNAGCGAVYGYSQSVTFVGDYKFEETFWNVIKEEGTIAEAYATMVDVWGPVDPYGNAWPIVMSPVDDFPANPDQAQTVYCDWTLFGESEEPIALEGYTLSANEANIAVGETVTVKFNREPEDANLYDIIWTSSDENVAVVDGNKRRVKITGSGSGTATVTGTVMVNGSVYGTAVIAVSVTGDEALAAALNVEGGNLWFGTSTEYPFTAVDDGTRVFARSGNKRVVNSKSQLMLTIAMPSGDTMAFDYICSSQTDRDFFNFYVNRQVELRKSGVTEPDWQRYTFTAPEDG